MMDMQILIGLNIQQSKEKSIKSKTNPICREYKKINNMNIKHLTICLFAACSLQASAQYLEHIYDYIENTTVFEENQEEGHADMLITLPRNICR